MSKIIDGKKIAENIKADILRKVKNLKKTPQLVAILVGENPASEIYSNSQMKLAKELGIKYKLIHLKKSATPENLRDTILKLNKTSSVDGIILLLPLPEGFNAGEFQSLIAPEKDVECINPSNLGNLVLGEISVAPCTAMAVWEIIKSQKINIKGKDTVIISHSAIVGKPINMLLLSSPDKSATTTCCHVATKNLSHYTKRADILIVAAGKPRFIKGSMIKKGAVVIDVGINRIVRGKKSEIVGDVDFKSVFKKAKKITPVPGGVGPISTVMLFKNLINLTLGDKFESFNQHLQQKRS